MRYFNHVYALIFFLEQGNIDAGTQCDLVVKSQGIYFIPLIGMYMIKV